MKKGLFIISSNEWSKNHMKWFVSDIPFDPIKICQEFYDEWYDVFNISYYKHLDMQLLDEFIVCEFNYLPIIKPYLTECLEYQIEMLS